MSKESNTAKGQLIELEKLTKKILRNSLKDNTLDYTVQISVSSNEPNTVKYAALISAPKDGVQPITYVFDNYSDLHAALVASEKEIDQEKVEVTFHESRINTYKTKIAAHEARLKEIEEGEPEIEMEAV